MTILAAIDENPESKQIVSIAYDLATAYDDTLVIMHVIPEEDYEAHRDSLEDTSGMNTFSVSQEEKSAERFVRRYVDEAVEDVAVERIEPLGRVGDAASEILAEADSRNPRYLVVGGRRRSPTGKALFGDTAQRILLNADCPVVTQMLD